MDYTAQPLTLLKNVPNVPKCFSFLYLLFSEKSFIILGELERFKRQWMAKTNDRVLKERLDTSRLNDIFLKIYPHDPTSKFQE